MPVLNPVTKLYASALLRRYELTMTDKMPDEIYAFHDDNDYDDSGAWSIYHEGNELDKYISEQKHADEIAALKAEHRAEISLIIAENQSLVNAMQLSNKQALAGLCDEILNKTRCAGYQRDLADVVNEIKQRISDE